MNEVWLARHGETSSDGGAPWTTSYDLNDVRKAATAAT